jgi:hypothetical protein
MGVHTTFVRSVDLDEWTQRQMDAMRLGGNANAQQFFRSHGLTDLTHKMEKKYTSKAAVQYKAELAKQVEAEAVKRGEGIAGAEVAAAGNMLDNLALQHNSDLDADARAKLAAARAAGGVQANVTLPSAKLASQNEKARGKLVVTPPNSGGLKIPLIRKPGTFSSSSMLLKKKSSGASNSSRVNKLVSQPSNGSDTQPLSEDTFGDIDGQLHGNAAAAATVPVPVEPAPQPVSAPAAPQPPIKSPEKPRSKMEDGVSKLMAMNNDFFSGF